MNSLVEVFIRSITYVYWLIAVIYVFWPKGRWCSKKRISAISINDEDDISAAFTSMDKHINVQGSVIEYPS